MVTRLLILSEKLIQDIYDRLAQEPYTSVAALIGRLQHEVANQPVPDPGPPEPPAAEKTGDNDG